MLNRYLWYVNLAVFLCASLLRQGSIATAQTDIDKIPIYELKLETASGVAWSPDGEVLAVGDTSGIRLYTPSLEFIGLLEQATDEMKTLAWSPDGRYLAASGVQDGWRQSDVYVWDYETREAVRIFDQHHLMVPMLAWSPDSQQIASASWDRTVQVWDAKTGDIYHTLSIHDDLYSTEVFSVTWSPVSNRIAAVVGMKMEIWDSMTGEHVQSFVGPKHPYPPNYNVINWSADGQYVLSNFNVLDAANDEELVFEVCPGSIFKDWNPDSRTIAVFTVEQIYICDALDDVVVMSFAGGVGVDELERVWGLLNALDWHPDGKRLASVSFDGTLRIWQIFEE